MAVSGHPTTAQREALTQPAADIDPVAAAEVVLRRFGPRAVTMLTTGYSGEGDARGSARLSANDCYVALDEACRKMARVAVRRYRQGGARGFDFAQAIDGLFPDPAAYLARAIRSVMTDEARSALRDQRADSLDRPVSGEAGHTMTLGDTIPEDDPAAQPEAVLLSGDERNTFRHALKQAFRAIPANYLAALRRDMVRERRRQAGGDAGRETATERQTLCRARAALASIIRRECGEDNPYVALLAQRRKSHVRARKQPSAAWSGEQSDRLFRQLLDSPWSQRASDTGDTVDEAIVNDVTEAGGAAPPSPDLRQAMRVLDLYTVDRPTPASPRARALYDEARAHREAGRLEQALASYRACHAEEPAFVEAYNEVGVTYSRLGRLRDALRVYLSIVEQNPPGDHRFIAATNAADIYMTWYDAGRSRARNIELAIQYARLAMERPTPMRACNLVQALAKDRYYNEARDVVADILARGYPRCAPERFLQTMFQIRDADLVAWWTWLETELEHDRREQ